MALGVGGVVIAKARAVLEADTRNLDRGLTQSEKRWREWNKVAVGASVGVIAAIGAAGKKSIDAAKEAETSAMRMRTQLAALGVNYGKHAEIIERVTDRQSKLFAIDDEELQDAFTQLVRATGDVDSALKSTALAADVARGKQITLEAATMVVTKAHMGQAGALRRMGIDVDKTATKQELLAALQQKFAGQAVAHGKSAEAASERHRVATENLQEQYGKGLLPTYTQAIEKLGGLLGVMSRHQGATQTTIVAVAGLATGVLAVNAAVKVYAATQAVATAATVAAGPATMAYRSALWATAAAGTRATAATKAMTAAQMLFAKTPIGLAITGVSLALGGMVYQTHAANQAAKDQRDQARDAAAAMRGWADGIMSVRQQQDLLAGKRADVTGAALAVEGAEKAYQDAVRVSGKRSHEARTYLHQLGEARRRHREAVIAESESIRKANKDRVDGVATARAAADGLSRLSEARRQLADAEDAHERKAGGWKGLFLDPKIKAGLEQRVKDNKQAVRVLEAQESAHLDTLDKLRNRGLIDYVKIGGQYQVVGRRGMERLAGITRAGAAAAARGANRELAKTGNVTIPREKVKRNLIAPFRGIGPEISKEIGRITVDIAAMFSGGTGDAFGGYGQVPRGVDPDVGRAAALGQTLGLTATSWLRPGAVTSSGNRSDHATGNAVDMAGPSGRMAAFYKALGNFPGLKQRIYSPLDGWSDDHHDHVHVAMYQQGGRVGRRGSGCHCSSCVERSAVMHANHGGRVPSMPWSGASGDSVPALLEPDEVVVNRSFTRAYPGGPSAFDRDTNGSVPRFARGGVAGALAGARARADESVRAVARREAAARKALASVVRRLAKTKPKSASRRELTERRNALADDVIRFGADKKSKLAEAKAAKDDAKKAKLEAWRERLVASTGVALAGRAFGDDLDSLRARNSPGLADDVLALDRRRGTNADRLSMLTGALGQTQHAETRDALQQQLNDAIREQIELDQERSQLIEQQNEQRQQEIASSVTRKYALSDAERDLLAAKAEATADIEDDKRVLQSEIDAWAAKLSDLQAAQKQADLTEATRIDLIGQEAAALRGLTDSQKRQAAITNELENQVQERLRSERDAILGARSRFQSEFASNTFAPGGRAGYVNGPATPTQVTVNQHFTSQPEDPWIWTKKSQFAAESVFGG